MELFNKTKAQKVLLGDICNKTEYVERNPEKNGIFKFLKVEHFDAENINISRWADLREEEIPPTFYKRFEKGQVLFPTRNPHLRRAAVAPFEGICGEKTLTLTPNEELIDPRLFPFLFHSNSFVNHCINFIVGSTNPHVRWRDVAKYEFLLPPLAEQNKLADLLWAGDTVLQRYRELESELGVYMRKYLLSNYQDTNKEKRSFGELFEINPKKETIRSGTTVSFISMSDVSEDGYVENMIEEELENVSSGYKSFIEGDILFAKITPCTENGKGAIAKDLKNGYGFGSTEFHVLRPYEASDRSFIYHISIAPFFRKLAERQMTGSAGQKRVPSEFIDNFKFHIPSPNDRQSIGKYLDHQQESIVKTRRMQNEILRVNKSLINKIFG